MKMFAREKRNLVQKLADHIEKASTAQGVSIKVMAERLTKSQSAAVQTRVQRELEARRI